MRSPLKQVNYYIADLYGDPDLVKDVWESPLAVSTPLPEREMGWTISLPRSFALALSLLPFQHLSISLSLSLSLFRSFCLALSLYLSILSSEFGTDTTIKALN